MNYIILSSILAILVFGFMKATPIFLSQKLKESVKNRHFIISGLVIFLIMTISFSAHIVPTGSIGTLKTFGAVDTTQILKEGLKWTFPWQRVISIDNRTTQTTLAQEAESASKDLQMVTTNLSMNWRFIPEKIPYIIQQFGVFSDGESITDRVITPAILETFKATISKYTVEELITKRAEVASNISLALSEKLSKYDIVIDAINITNFEFSQQFNAAIEAKVTATQNALKAQQDLTRIQIEAQQAIATARGSAESIKIMSEAIRAQGGADYVKLKFIEKWNGTLPQTMLQNAMPFLNVPVTAEK